MSVLGLLAAVALGAVFGLLVVYQLLWALLRVYRKLCGLAIVEGCEVRILRGPRRGLTARVYEVWDERGQIRVNLGDEMKKAVKDVYMSYEAERVRSLLHGVDVDTARTHEERTGRNLND